MKTEKLTKNFTVGMLTRSETAARRGIDNSPDEAALERLMALATFILEPLKEKYGRRLVITSGFRSVALNTAIGGSRNSQHMLGEAADLIVAGTPNLEVAKWLKNNIAYGQIIHEFGEWVHVSLPRNKLPETLTCYRRDGKVIYEPGLKEVPSK